MICLALSPMGVRPQGALEGLSEGPLGWPTFGNPNRQSAANRLESTFKLTYSPFPDEQS